VILGVNAREAGCSVVSVDIPVRLACRYRRRSRRRHRRRFHDYLHSSQAGDGTRAAGPCVGQLLVRQIGSPPALIEETGKGKLRWSEPAEFTRFAIGRKAAGNKGDYGHALVVAGSVGKSGAAVSFVLGGAALRSRAVTVATPEPVLPIVAAHTPEIMTEPLAATTAGTVSARCLDGSLFATLLKGKSALAIGPGLSTHAETRQFVRTVVGNRSVPIILDADGLNAFAGHAPDLNHADGILCVTPHPGEMARLLGATVQDVQARRVEIALQLRPTGTPSWF